MVEFSPISFFQTHQVGIDLFAASTIENARSQMHHLASFDWKPGQIKAFGNIGTHHLALALAADYQVAPWLSKVGLTSGVLMEAVKQDLRHKASLRRPGTIFFNQEASSGDFVKPRSDFQHFSPKLNMVLDRSVAQAQILGKGLMVPEVDSRHLLLGLVLQPDTQFEDALAYTGTSLDPLKAYVISRVTGNPFDAKYFEDPSDRPRDSLDLLRTIFNDPQTDLNWKFQMLKFIDQGIKTRPINPDQR